MTSNVLDHLADHIHSALKAAFSELINEYSDQHFDAFAIFTHESLQFIHPAANTEEGLTATVQRYLETVDPKYGMTLTSAGMHWCYGDWQHFANFGAAHFNETNESLTENIDSPIEEYEAHIHKL